MSDFPTSDRAPVRREATVSIVPVGARCVLCGLWCFDGDPELAIWFGEAGTPLAALNKHQRVCLACIKALWQVSARFFKEDR